ncbi:hypothetical protein [Francisella philomiragia]|uniref:hypothetical protein n=1 Tax=Francisella philomiragia TaxID=28110 RepID=UPI000B590407|nr:hypothetical protein [Francisella philomiragia]MBK2094866.1 hypothetical protein [Francisella philomiragia]
MKNKIFLVSIFGLALSYSFASEIYEKDDNGVPTFSNEPTKNSKKLDLGDINVVDEPSDSDKITINNNINISNQTNSSSNDNNQLENNYYSGYCSQYYDNYSSYSYIPYECGYFFHRPYYGLDNAANRTWDNIDREKTDHYIQQNINANRITQAAAPMGMRMAGGRR